MKPPYTGTWHIIEMEGWDADYIDLIGPGYLTIGRDASGFMQYGAVEADLDCRVEQIGDSHRLEFSFHGFDEGDAISGRGWAAVEDKEMTGQIYIHRGEEFPFKAVRTTAAKVRSAPVPKIIPLPRQRLSPAHHLEPTVYSAKVFFKQQRPSLAEFARELGIAAEMVAEIEEDCWGTRDSLEIGFQAIEGRTLRLHIQRAHFRRKDAYVRDLQAFLAQMEALPYVQRIDLETQ